MGPLSHKQESLIHHFGVITLKFDDDDNNNNNINQIIYIFYYINVTCYIGL